MSEERARRALTDAATRRRRLRDDDDTRVSWGNAPRDAAEIAGLDIEVSELVETWCDARDAWCAERGLTRRVDRALVHRTVDDDDWRGGGPPMLVFGGIAGW